MKKAILMIFLMGTILTACAPDNQFTSINNLTNDNQSTEIVEIPTVVVPTATMKEAVVQTQSQVTCTAVSEEKVELTQPSDWITGKAEGYSVTLIEYGDYQ
jgi:hypothetical protein